MADIKADNSVIPNSDHRKIAKTLDSAKTELIEDIVYSMALEGMPLVGIARFFGVKIGQLAPFTAIHDMGKAALERQIFRRQISLGMTSNFAQPAFFCGVQFANQSTGKVDEDGFNGDVKVQISVVGGKDVESSAGVGRGVEKEITYEPNGNLH